MEFFMKCFRRWFDNWFREFLRNGSGISLNGLGIGLEIGF